MSKMKNSTNLSRETKELACKGHKPSQYLWFFRELDEMNNEAYMSLAYQVELLDAIGLAAIFNLQLHRLERNVVLPLTFRISESAWEIYFKKRSDRGLNDPTNEDLKVMMDSTINYANNILFN